MGIRLTGLIGASLLLGLSGVQAETQLAPVVPVTNAVAAAGNPASGTGQLQLLQKLNAMQQELQGLRNEVETLAHEVETLKNRQRDVAADLDRRLIAVERSAVVPVKPVSTPGGTLGAAGGGVSVAPVSPGDAALEKERYDLAFNELKAGRYPEAIDALRGVLALHPSGEYADNAQYWIGEAYYVTRQFETALQAFQTVLEKYPSSDKVPDAMLKTGFIHQQMNNLPAARKMLSDVIRLYPAAAAARLAENRLRELDSAGQ